MALRSISSILTRLFDTQKKRRWFALLLVILVLLFLIKGCSTDGKIERPYKVAYDVYWGRINLMGMDRNISAFSRVLLSSIAHTEKLRIELSQTSSNTDLILGLNNHEFDGILTSLQPSPINQNTLAFSEPYFMLGSVLVVREASPVKGWNELSRKIVAVQYNSPSILDIEKDPTIQIKTYDNILNALADLDNGSIDGALFPALQAYVYANTFYAGRLRVATPPLTNEGLRLVTLNNAEGKKLIQAFNEGLNTLKETGEFTKLLSSWGLVDMEKLNQKQKVIPENGVVKQTINKNSEFRIRIALLHK
jgi:polar amino acid transport system substrate-binding protein